MADDSRLIQEGASALPEVFSRRKTPSPDHGEFGPWVTRRRKSLDLTRDELAQLINCATPTLRKVETGDRRPSKELATRLAVALRIEEGERTAFMEFARRRPAKESLEPFPARADFEGYQHSRPLGGDLSLPTTPLIGRESEVTTLTNLLARPDCRLITITGIGGVGKTRLALEVASNHRKDFRDGVWAIGLADLVSADLLIPRILTCLGAERGQRKPPEDYLLEHLNDRNALLLLDNFEHVADAASFLSEILFCCPKVKVLCTSRLRLGLRAEWVYQIEGLAMPDDGATDIGESAAVALFLDCLARLGVADSVGDAESRIIGRICRLLGGLPLAIEMAASWAGSLPFDRIADYLEKRVLELGTELRDVPERHRSLAAVIRQSWSMLSADEGKALEILSLFRSVFSFDAAEAIAKAEGPLIMGLIDKALITRRADGRFGLHELVKRFASERLAASPLLGQAMDRYLEFYLSFATKGGAAVADDELVIFVDEFEKEHENIGVALEWAFGDHGDPIRLENGLALVCSCAQCWTSRGHLQEGIGWLDRGLSAACPVDPAIKARALVTAGWLANGKGDLEGAMALLETGEELFRSLGDAKGLGDALDNKGDVASRTGDYEFARSAYAESIEHYRRAGNQRSVGITLASTARLESDYGDQTRARELALEALAILSGIDSPIRVAFAQNVLGRIYLFSNELEKALACFKDSLRKTQRFGCFFDLSEIFMEIAVTVMGLGDTRSAQALMAASETLRARIGVKYPDSDPLSILVGSCGLADLREDENGALGLTTDEAIALALVFEKPLDALHEIGRGPGSASGA